jgi:hypothetical protein
MLALPAPAEPRELEAPPAVGGETPAAGEAPAGAQVYVLDSSRRPSR